MQVVSQAIEQRCADRAGGPEASPRADSGDPRASQCFHLASAAIEQPSHSDAALACSIQIQLLDLHGNWSIAEPRHQSNELGDAARRLRILALVTSQ